MPDPYSIPFKQASGNGHYASKQLPNDRAEFLLALDLPAELGDINGSGAGSDNQIVVYAGETGTDIRPAVETGIAKVNGGRLSAVPAPVGDIVGTTDVQTLTNKTITNSSITAPIGITKADVGLGNVDNTSDADKPVSLATQSALNLKEDKANKAVVNGYASLGPTGKVPLDQMDPSVVGAQRYMGTWNAAINNPTIPPAAVGNSGNYYTVSTSGSTNIDGISSWAVGDQIISNGTIWQKIPVTNAVQSVNGKTGIVVVNKNDVGLANVDNTSDLNKPLSNADVTALALKQDLSAKNQANGYAGLDATGKVPVAQSQPDLVTSVAGRQGVVVLTKSDVGLNNVDNTSDATKNSQAVTLTNKTIVGANQTLMQVRLDADVVNNLPVSRLNGGTGANATSFWRGDGTWITPPGGGDVTGPASSAVDDIAVFAGTTGKVLKTTGRKVTDVVVGPASAVDGEVVLFDSTTGKLIKRATGTGLVILTSGVQSTVATIPPANMPTGSVIQSWFGEYTLNANLAAIPGDNSVPQIGEGTQIILIPCVPYLATSKLRCTFKGQGGVSADAFMTAALFAGAGPGAIDATCAYMGFAPASAPAQPLLALPLCAEFLPGSTASIDIQVRAGGSAANVMRMNGTPNGRFYGGASRATLVVEEIKV